MLSKEMDKILTARQQTDLPKSKVVWKTLCQKACHLYDGLDADGLIDYLPTVYPVLCLLIKGSFYFQIHRWRKARKLMFDEEPFLNLIQAATFVNCPYTFADRLLAVHKSQLLITGPGDNPTPLHVLCRQEAPLNYDRKIKTLIHLFAASCNKAAAQIDTDGYFPLHSACKSKHTWSTGIESLVKAAPQVVALSCENRTPFVLSALAHAPEKSHPERSALVDAEVTETLFELLRYDPTVVKRFF